MKSIVIYIIQAYLHHKDVCVCLSSYVSTTVCRTDNNEENSCDVLQRHAGYIATHNVQIIELCIKFHTVIKQRGFIYIIRRKF